jgi:hypothetical protein
VCSAGDFRRVFAPDFRRVIPLEKIGGGGCMIPAGMVSPAAGVAAGVPLLLLIRGGSSWRVGAGVPA